MRAELLDYYQRHYSANMMTLAVVGREDLDTLELWVTDLFSEVQNKDVPPPEAEWAGKVAAMSAEARGEVLYAVPVQDVRILQMSWVLPFTSRDNKRMRLNAKPDAIASFLIGNPPPCLLVSLLALPWLPAWRPRACIAAAALASLLAERDRGEEGGRGRDMACLALSGLLAANLSLSARRRMAQRAQRCCCSDTARLISDDRIRIDGPRPARPRWCERL